MTSPGSGPKRHKHVRTTGRARPTKVSASTPPPASAAKAVQIAKATDAIVRSGRRAATAIDRLPEEVRQRVRDMLLDRTRPYLDIAETILRETTPEALRADLDAAMETMRAEVAAIKAADGPNRAEKAREKKTREIWQDLCAKADLGVAGESALRPILLSDDTLSREYAEQVRDMAAVQCTIRLIEDLVGADSGPADGIMIGVAWAKHMLSEAFRRSRAARTASAWKAQMKHLKDVSHLLRTLAEIQRLERTDAERLDDVHRVYVAKARKVFAARPDLREQIAALFAQAREGADAAVAGGKAAHT